MMTKGDSSQRRDCHGQRGVIAALEAAEASWIWTTNMHAAESNGKQEDLAVGAAIVVTEETSPGGRNINDNVK